MRRVFWVHTILEQRDEQNIQWRFDCSSFMLGIYSYAGFPLLDSIGNELLTSTYQVKAAGFELLYPAKRAEIGKNLPSPSG